MIVIFDLDGGCEGKGRELERVKGNKGEIDRERERERERERAILV